MRRLASSEREIKRSAGIALTRFWPFALMFVTASIMSFDQQLFQRCLGHPLEGGGRLGAVARLAAAVPCSFYNLRGPLSKQMEFVCFWGRFLLQFNNYGG